MKNKGYLALESIVVLGIISIIISASFLIFSNSLKVKNKILDFKNREINYRKNIEYFLDEIQQGKNVYIDKNKLKYEIFLENKIVGVYYYFSGTSFYRKASNSEKLEEFLEGIKGDFFLENNLLRIKFIFKGNEEEYVAYVQEK